MTSSLCFNRDQLKAVLTDFVQYFQSHEARSNLRLLAPDEAKINGAIEEAQKSIFKKHGVDPERGFAELRHIPKYFASDKEILQLLIFCSNKEELVIGEALSMKDNANHDLQEKMINLDFSQLQKQWNLIQNDPQQRQMFMQVMQQNMNALPPEERQLVQTQMMQGLTPEQLQQAQQLQQHMSQRQPQQMQMNMPVRESFLRS